MKKPKTGRLINAKERTIAAKWVIEYRKAQKEPNQRLCLNEKDEPDCQVFLNYNDPEPLLHLLDTIAKQGTLIDVKMAVMVNDLLVNEAVIALRQQGKTRNDAIAIVATRKHVSVRTIERVLPKKDKKTPIRDTDCG